VYCIACRGNKPAGATRHRQPEARNRSGKQRHPSVCTLNKFVARVVELSEYRRYRLHAEN